MKTPTILLAFLILIGCSEVAPEPSSETDMEAGSIVASETLTTSYSSGDSATMAVPEMSCAIMCFPKVKDALESIEGVEGVELVEQQDEVVLDDRRIVVKFDGSVDSGSAVAALKEAGYPNSSFE